MTITNDAGSLCFTGEHLDWYQMRTQLAAFKLEMLGMRHSRGSVYAQVKRVYNLKGSKQKVYDQFEIMVNEVRDALTGDQL